MGKIKLSEVQAAAPVVRAVPFQHPQSGEAFVIYLRRPNMAGLLAIREAARADIHEWCTIKEKPDGTKVRPNLYQVDGKAVPMSETLWHSVNAIYGMQCAEDGNRLPEAERYSKKELVEFSVKLDDVFVDLANAAGELFDQVTGEAKNSPGVSADAGSEPSPETDANTPA